MKKQTIGVEIEFTGIARDKAAEAIARYFGTTAKYVGGQYAAWQVKDTVGRGRKWHVQCDVSIHAQEINPNTGRTVSAMGSHKCELVTPILKWADIETLKGVVNAVKAAGGFVNESCGLHVHIGAKNFTAQGLRNLVNIVGSRENLFYKVFATLEDRKNYCRPTSTRVINQLNTQKPKDLDAVKAIWYDGRVGAEKYHYDHSRYTIANLHAFFNKGTIEFRLFNATLDADEVMTAVHFTAAIVNFAKTVSHTVYRRESDCTFKSEVIRATAFFNKIGLVGDEFKTTRHHLLKNLNGNAARRTHAA